MIDVTRSDKPIEHLWPTVATSTAYSLAGFLLHASIHPIGPGPGALFGAANYLARIPIVLIGQKLFDSSTSSAAKALLKALEILGSFAIAWAALVVAGISLTLPQVVVLGGLGYLLTPGIVFVMQTVGKLLD